MGLQNLDTLHGNNTFSIGGTVIKELKFKNSDVPSLLFSVGGKYFLLPLLNGTDLYIGSIKGVDKVFLKELDNNILTVDEYVDIRLHEKELLSILERDAFWGKTIINGTHEFEQNHQHFIEEFLLFIDERRAFTFGNRVEKQAIEKRREIVKIVS